jgi:type I restriction enzyme, S subunit
MNQDRSTTITNSQLKEGYKQTEIGVIPEDWEVGTLDKYWSVIDCKHVTAKFIRSGIPVASIREVQSRFVNIDNANQTTEICYKQLIEGGRKPQHGDLILSRNATVGEIAQVADWHPYFAMGQDVCLLRKRSTNSSTALLQAIIQSWIVLQQLENCMVGSTFRRVNVEQIKNLTIPLPPTKAEQEAIACTLSDIDALIESLDRLLTKKRQIKQGAMQELLRSEDERIEKRLGDLAHIVRGASPRPIDSPIWFDENSEIGWVRISDITKSGIFLYETTQKLSPLGVKSSRFVARNSLIMSICATVGRPIITAIDTCIHDGFVVFEDLQADMRFIFYVLQSIEDDWGKHGQTGSQMNLNTNLINSTNIFIPESREEQIEIANILSDMDAEIGSISAKIAKTRQLKQGMMHELLTGRIRLVDAKL